MAAVMVGGGGSSKATSRFRRQMLVLDEGGLDLEVGTLCEYTSHKGQGLDIHSCNVELRSKPLFCVVCDGLEQIVAQTLCTAVP